ncbi:hypothetical protein BGZ83_011647 [Gryganskiella cystojenkinii]|nr:hypothetical protein BGZ83_011647 [Gryganskiella cystojenkinii]
MSTITNEVLRRFCTKDLQERDLKRSIEAAMLFGTWTQATFNSKVFYLGAKIGNTVVHTRILNLALPTCLPELRSLDQTFFFRMFQIQSLVQITSRRLRQERREPKGDNILFPTLATPLRNAALGIQSKAKVGKRKGKETMEMSKAKRNKETVQA